MTRIPVLSGKKLVRALLSAGFTVERTSGSHHIMRNPGPPVRNVTVPIYGNKELKRATLNGILKQAGLSVAELERLL